MQALGTDPSVEIVHRRHGEEVGKKADPGLHSRQTGLSTLRSDQAIGREFPGSFPVNRRVFNFNSLRQS
jgi:hypothetical protein